MAEAPNPNPSEPTLEQLTKDLAKLQAKLEDSNKSNKELAKDLEQAMKLVRLDTPEEDAIAALRYTMKKAGYSHGEIEDYIAAQTAPAPTREPPHSHPDGTPPLPRGTTSSDDGLLEGLREVLGQMASRINSIEGQVNQSRSRSAKQTAADLRERIDASIEQHLDENRTLDTILKKVAPESAKARATLKKDVLLHAKEILREQARGGNHELDAKAVKAAVSSAATEVEARYRTVIGDPSSIGRSPETVAESARFLNEKPVPVPEFNAEKDTLSDIRAKSREWAADALGRDQAKQSTEESVV